MFTDMEIIRPSSLTGSGSGYVMLVREHFFLVEQIAWHIMECSDTHAQQISWHDMSENDKIRTLVSSNRTKSLKSSFHNL